MAAMLFKDLDFLGHQENLATPIITIRVAGWEDRAQVCGRGQLQEAGLTKPTPADLLRGHGPQLPLRLDLLQDSLMKGLWPLWVGLQLPGSDLHTGPR